MNEKLIYFSKRLNRYILISFVFPQFTSFYSVFHSFHGLMNSIDWPASSIWVFIAQLGEHCSANAEATGSNPVEAPKNFFSGYFRNCLNCDSLRWSHTHFICIPTVHIILLCLTLLQCKLGGKLRPCFMQYFVDLYLILFSAISPACGTVINLNQVESVPLPLKYIR